MRHTHVTDAKSMLEIAADGTREWLLRPLPLGDKLKAFYAACRVARDCGTWDAVEAEFIQLARDTGLVRALGHSGEHDIKRLIGCALRDEKPPMKLMRCADSDDFKAALLKPPVVDEWLVDFWLTCRAARKLAGMAGYTPIEVALLVLADGTGLTGMIGEDEICHLVRHAMREDWP